MDALQVLMNGRPLGVQFKRNSAYVAQEDCFVPTMSAVETLNFTATLTLPKSVTVQERADRIEEVLRIMGLYRSRDTQVTRASPRRSAHASAYCFMALFPRHALSAVPRRARDARSVCISAVGNTRLVQTHSHATS